MKRKVGFYGGKFYPLPHMGHLYAMIKASTMVEELHVIVSYDDEYERTVLSEKSKVQHISFEMRVRWWREIVKDMPHVHVHAVYEKQTGSLNDWYQGSLGIQDAVGKEIDTVFSSEHTYTDVFKFLYRNAEHIIIDENRVAYPISGTKIRQEGILKNWEMIPLNIRPHFVKRVVVVGTESTGKSTLVKNLARMYNTTYVEEFGRTFYERIGGCEDVTIASDYPRIAYEHKYHEDKQSEHANKLLFIDTEAIVTQFFSMAYLDTRQKVLTEIAKIQKYDLWLFLEPDVKWVDDGTRSFGNEKTREGNNNILKALLSEFGVDYISISGNYNERLNKAVSAVDDMLKGEY